MSHVKRFLAAFLLLFAILAGPLPAQERFDATLFGGLNLCQIDGDESGRYNHPGLRAGVGSSMVLGRDAQSPWRLSAELAFSQKGSRIVRESFTRTIALSYVELPISLTYSFLEGRLRLSAGVAPAVLVKARVKDGGGEENNALAEKFKRFDWLPVRIGARYLFTDHLALEAHFQTSMLSISESTGSGSYRIFHENKGTFNRIVNFGLAYTF